MKRILRVTAVLVAGCILTAGCGAEQTKEESFEPTPITINTVERHDDIVLTVMRDQETVFQYAGDIELWKGADGKAYGIIYLDGEEVLQ